MNQHQLTEILERAAAPVRRPDLATEALLRASQTRRRRSTAAVSLAAAAVVVAVVFGVQAVDGRSEPGPEPAPPGPSGDATPPADQGEAIPDSVVQEFWDPATVSSLALRNSVLPEQVEQPSSAPPLEVNPIDAAVLSLWGERDVTYLMSPDGEWRSLPHPGPRPSSAVLSDDGTRLALPDESGLVVWDLGEGTGTTLPWPGGLPRPSSEFVPTLRWAPDGAHVLAGAARRSWLLGLDGSVEELPFPTNRYNANVYFADDGRVLEFAYDLPGSFGRALVEWDGAERVQTSDVTPLESLTGAAVRGGLVAATRGDGGYYSPRSVSDWDGLIVFGRDDLTARAYLPIRDGASTYSDNGNLLVQGWLDDETVLAWVRPRLSAGQLGADWWLVAWHHPTGDVLRLAGGDAYARLTDVVPALVE